MKILEMASIVSSDLLLLEPLLCNFNDKNNSKDHQQHEIRKLWTCDWLSVIDSPKIKSFYKSGLKETTNEDENGLLTTAISCLFAFIQENFVGPKLSDDYKIFLQEYWPSDINANLKLFVDSEELNPNIKYPEFLLTAKIIMENCLQTYENAMVLNWWKLRLICIHQKILDELSNSLYIKFCELVDKLSLNVEKVENLEIKALLFVEIAFGYLLFHRTQKVEQYLEKIYHLLDIDLKIEGLLGVRTKFQQKPLPQLSLTIEQNLNNLILSAAETNSTSILPKLLTLDDDILLERVKFLAEKDNEITTFPSIIQAVILLKLELLLKSQPKDKLADEELEPYVKSLLYQEHGPLSIRLSALFLQIRQEQHKKRTVERSLKQCEEILKTIEGDKFPVFQRFSYGFASDLLPRYEIQKQLGDIMVSLGLIKTALDLYLEIQEWESVIECYTRLDLRHKAAEIIRQELEKKPTVKLYCLLGDATDNVSCYETAWKLSNEASARAQRHWGSYYFAKKQYKEALPHLQKSVEINSLQETTWLRVGYSAIMLEKWELAVHAYLTYTHIEPHGFESWNNLAKALIKLGDKKRAHKILGEALKCNYNNWKVWENFLLVSVDTGNFEDALNAYSRLNELKEKFIDLEIIEIISKAVAEGIPDAQGRSVQRLRKKCNTILAHQCVQHPSEYKLWEFAALLAETSLSRAQKLQKCYLSYVQKNTSTWLCVEDVCLKAIEICKMLCENSLEAIRNYDEAEKSSALSQLSSARLSAQGCIRNVEQNGDKSEAINSSLESLKNLLQICTDELKSRM